MFCNNCGAKMPEDRKTAFCVNCGAPLESEAKAAPANTNTPTNTNNVPTNTASTVNVDVQGFKNKVVNNYLISSFVLAAVGFVSTKMAWLAAPSLVGKALSSMNMPSSMSLFEVIDMMKLEDPKIASYVSLLMLALPVIGLALVALGYFKKDDADPKYTKYGQSGMLVMGIGGVITYLVASKAVSYANEAMRGSMGSMGGKFGADLMSVSLGTGAKLWLAVAILQIVLFVLVKKKNQVK